MRFLRWLWCKLFETHEWEERSSAHQTYHIRRCVHCVRYEEMNMLYPDWREMK